jgi:hypothetical protein
MGITKLAGGAAGLLPGKVGEEARKELREYNLRTQDMQDSWANWLGQVGGQTVLTAPIGGVGANAARALPGVMGKIAPALVHTGVNALQGAATDPEHPAGGAVSGAVLPLALRGAGGLATSAVRQSPAAMNLIERAQAQGRRLFIPISQAADAANSKVAGFFKGLYTHALPISMGAGRNLENQSNKAQDEVRRMIVQRSLPPGVSMPIDPSRQGMEDLAQDVQERYNSQLAHVLGDRAIKTNPKGIDIDPDVPGHAPNPNIHRQEIRDFILNNTAHHPGHLSTAITPFKVDQLEAIVQHNLKPYIIPRSYGGNDVPIEQHVLGVNFHRAVEGVRAELANSPEFTPEEKQATIGAMMNMVRENASETGKMLDQPKKFLTPLERERIYDELNALSQYERLSDQYDREMRPWIQGVQNSAADRGDFDFRRLAQTAPQGSTTRDIAQDASTVFGDSAARANAEGRHGMRIGSNLGATGLAGVLGGPWGAVGVGAPLLTGSVLSTKAAQNILYGNTAAQRSLREMMADPRKNEYIMNLLSGAGTAAWNDKGVDPNATGQ